MPSRRDYDPVGNYNFTFYMKSIAEGFFSTVEGLSFEIEMIEYRVSDDPRLPRYRPGLPKYGRITLKRGYINGIELQEWMKKVQAGEYTRHDATISLNDNAGNEVCAWNLHRCLPVKWTIGGFEGKGNEVMYESLEMVVEEVVPA